MPKILLKAILVIIIAFINLTSFPALTKPLETKQTEQDKEFDEFDEEEFETYETENKQEKIYDPYEKVNRKIYAFNDAFDRYFFEHVAKAYRKSIPGPARKAIHNFLNNLSLPISAINSIAQGKLDNSLATISNFLINTTVGIGGIFNIAGKKGINYEVEDFGQTLGHYGVGSGAYLVIPFLGPSSVRDLSGWTADQMIDPFGFNILRIGDKASIIDNEYRIALTAISQIDIRENLIDVINGIRNDSFDPYATVRSAYLQRRNSKVNN